MLMASFRRAACALSRFIFVWADLAVAWFELTLPPVYAQTATQQLIYGSGSVSASTSAIVALNKNDTTGALAALPGTPIADRLEGGLVAIDGQGKFLFVLNSSSNNISMYQIDGSTGLLTEVPNSPFAAGGAGNSNPFAALSVSFASGQKGSILS